MKKIFALMVVAAMMLGVLSACDELYDHFVDGFNAIVQDGQVDIDEFEDTFAAYTLTFFALWYIAMSDVSAQAGGEASPFAAMESPVEAFDYLFNNEVLPAVGEWENFTVAEWLTALQAGATVQLHAAFDALPLDEMLVREIMESRMKDAEFMARLRENFLAHMEEYADMLKNREDIDLSAGMNGTDTNVTEPPTITSPPEGSAAVVVNGTQIIFEDQNPVIADGRTLVPVRGVFQAMGWNVSWDAEAQTARLFNAETTIRVEIGAEHLVLQYNLEHFPGRTFYDSRYEPLDVPAQIINGRTMIPLRAVAYAAGADVRWDAALRTAFITTN